jgi:hypothetical protein
MEFSAIFALTKIGLVAQLNSALDYGSRGFWFESRQGHKTKRASIY